MSWLWTEVFPLPLDLFKGEIFMRYTVTAFRVRLEVAESGIRMRNSEIAAIVPLKNFQSARHFGSTGENGVRVIAGNSKEV